MPVIVVTDSSAQLEADDPVHASVRRVPLHILLDGEDLRDGIDRIPADVYDRHASTAGATPAELSEMFRRALHDSGGDGVVAVHISAALSSTFSSAVAAAREFGPAVRVVNSRSAAMGVGFVALTAARSALAGADLDTVEQAARAAATRGRGFIVVHRLDNLRRSGRIGTTASWLGTALSLKPLLTLDVDGRLVLAQRVRTATKARAAMVDQIAGLVGQGSAALAVHHVGNPQAAAEVVEALGERLPQLAAPTVSDLDPVLAVHVGAGAVAVLLQLAEDGPAEP